MPRISLDLRTDSLRKFFINPNRFILVKEELEAFLDEEKHMNTKEFATKVLFSQEVKSNNSVEGYNDDMSTIEDVIKKASRIKDTEKRQRILNLYQAYQHILNLKELNPDTLRELYQILSNHLLSPLDLRGMGDFYRTSPVIITNRLDGENAYYGMEVHELNIFMESFFNYLNNNDAICTETDYYIKSQIMHFYFVYIHPYYDVNGRTSRTISMWYLLKNEAYPYIIFNRGINYNRAKYDEAIEDVRKYYDLTYFVKYMVETVKVELEKEYIMQSIASNTNIKLTAEDYQTLLCFLSLRGNRSVCDFATLYNRLNDHHHIKNIYLIMIEPLIDCGIFRVNRDTKKYMFDTTPNQILSLNPSVYDVNPNKIKRLVL